MSRASGILKRVNGALNKVTPTNRLVYKRMTQYSGDSLIGRVTPDTTDILLSPQPSVSQIGRQHLSGERDKVETVINSDGTRLVKDDYILIISGDAITETELQNNNLSFVFKTVDGEEALFVMDYAPLDFQGLTIVYEAYVRSVKV